MEQKNNSVQSAESGASVQLVVVARLRRLLAGLMHVDAHEVLRPPDEVIAFRGQVEGDTEAAYGQISQHFAEAGYTTWLRDREGGGHEVIAAKGKLEHKPGQVWVNAALLFVTVLSVLYIGVGYGMGDAGISPDALSPGEALIVPLRYLYLGVPFAATLMGILLAHELSHYFVARRYGSPVSLPYFIPMPFSIIGTMGAVIVQRAHMRSRRAVFDIGIAGPLGGLVVAIPLLVVGLALSHVGPPPADVKTAFQEGNSLLYLGLKYLVFGRILPSNGEDVWLHSVAFAAWAGLLVTMVNLVPIGQLDGGHISYALLGRRASTLGYIVIGAMMTWGGWLILAQGNAAGGFWITWGFLNLVMNRRHPLPADDATKLGWPRIALGLLVLVLFALLFMPAPLQEVVF